MSMTNLNAFPSSYLVERAPSAVINLLSKKKKILHIPKQFAIEVSLIETNQLSINNFLVQVIPI